MATIDKNGVVTFTCCEACGGLIEKGTPVTVTAQYVPTEAPKRWGGVRKLQTVPAKTHAFVAHAKCPTK